MFENFFSYFFLFFIFSFHFFFISYIYLREEILFLPAFVVLFVCLSVNNFTQKLMNRFSMKFSGSVGAGPRRNRLDFGSYW